VKEYYIIYFVYNIQIDHENAGQRTLDRRLRCWLYNTGRCEREVGRVVEKIARAWPLNARLQGSGGNSIKCARVYA